MVGLDIGTGLIWLPTKPTHLCYCNTDLDDVLFTPEGRQMVHEWLKLHYVSVSSPGLFTVDRLNLAQLFNTRLLVG